MACRGCVKLLEPQKLFCVRMGGVKAYETRMFGTDLAVSLDGNPTPNPTPELDPDPDPDPPEHSCIFKSTT